MLVNEKECCGCEACSNICPVKAIEIVVNKEGFLLPKVNTEKCINCGLCERVCPVINKDGLKNDLLFVLIAQNNDNAICIESSSGGIGHAISQYVIEQNGVVYGAAFDDDFLVEHIRCESNKEILRIMGSKYVQSKMKNIYKKIEADIKENRLVCFFGTPCQNEAVRKYIRSKNMDMNLVYLIDFPCHGVPSPMIWENYIEYLKYKNKSDIIKIKFRNKRNGWKEPDFHVEFSDKIFSEGWGINAYYNCFFRNYILRESCYDCKFTTIKRSTDMTIGDFWGAEQFFPNNKNIQNGVSLVLLNSHKGKKLFEAISSKCWYHKAELSMCYQRNLYEPTPRPKNRDDFWMDYWRENRKENTILKWGKVNRFAYKLKRIVVEILKKLKLYTYFARVISKGKKCHE